MGTENCEVILSEKNLRNIVIYMLPRFVQHGMYLLTLPIFARLLMPEDFGIVALALAFPTIAVGVVTVGLTGSVTRYFFEYKNNIEKLHSLYCSTQLYLYVMLIVSTLVMYISKDYISKLIMGKTDYGMAIFITYIGAYLNNINTLYLRIYQNMEMAVSHSLFVVLQVVGCMSASILLVWYFKMSYMGLIYGTFIGTFISCAIMSVHFNWKVRINFDLDILIENIKYGLQGVPKTFSGVINKYFDKYLLNAILSISFAGIYSIGQQFVNVIFVLMSNVWEAFQPVYYREVFDKGEMASETVGRIFTIFSYITFFPIILCVLFAQEIIHIIFPPSYYGAIEVVIILAAGLATQTFGMFVGIQYDYTKKLFWIFPITVFGTILNIMFNIYLIPRYGLIGAGLATVVSVGGMNLFLTYIGQKFYKIKYQWSTLISLFIILIAATIVFLYLGATDISKVYLYLIKIIFLSGFIYVGIRSNIISKHSIQTVFNSLFRISQKVA